MATLIAGWQNLTRFQQGTIIAVLSAIMFGLYPAATRAFYADHGNVALAVIISSWIRAASLTGYCAFRRVPLFPTKAITRQAIIGGLFQTISVLGILGGCAFIPGPVVLIILFTHTLMLLFFMAVRGEIKLDALNSLSALMALIGLVFVVDLWGQHDVKNWWGVALAFMAALATVSRLYVYQHQLVGRDSAAVGAENFIFCAFFSLIIAAVQTPQMPAGWYGWFWIFMASASLSLATFGMFYGISLLGSFQWSLFSKIEPIFTSLFSIFILGEYLKPSQYAGMVLVLGSLVFYQWFSQKKKAV